VAATQAFANPIPPAALATLPLTITAAQVTANVIASAGDEITGFVYDADGHVRYKIDASGRVCEYAYDAFGNLTRQTEYAKAITPAASYTVASVQAFLDVAPT